ncbi:MAG: hypothetical protein JST52_08635 [Bacteroidetes bacterium]|nr:hypothetical protein [Bacteroidota bacterium]MBS1739391.1 hypothetical protein [Bacteroidota bacterium]MBS1775274.1 hypothetical protein [Bacteroidota bacterium]
MNLSETWFIEGYIDFELQKYKLLAYLKQVNRYFNETKLYPQLADVIFHYHNLLAFRDNKKFLQDQFPKHLNQVDIEKAELVYEQMLNDSDLMKELETITQFGIEQMQETINAGTEIYELIEKQTILQPVGILPLYKNEGYFLLRDGQNSATYAYNYSVTLFEHQSARYKGIRVNFIEQFPNNIGNTYEQIKREIVRTIRTLPNPAVYAIETALTIPMQETLLPIAKRMLVKTLAHS